MITFLLLCAWLPVVTAIGVGIYFVVDALKSEA